MANPNKSFDRRSFLKVSTLTGGGLMLNFSWITGQAMNENELSEFPAEWIELNSYIKISTTGAITLYSANPEFGSNVKTSLPMIVAEELDVDWKKVVVEQADFYPKRYNRQFTGGSQGIRQGWKPLRTAGATARQLLVLAAAQTWNVPPSEVSTSNGMLLHKISGRSMGYGQVASLASTLKVPQDIQLKPLNSFTIVGTSKKNVDLEKIITGKPLFGIDHSTKGMLYAMIVHPPAFGKRFKSFNASSVKSMPGIVDAFPIKIMNDTYKRNFFDTATFIEMVAIVGKSTWQVMQAKKSIVVEWENSPETTFEMAGRAGESNKQTVPAGLESTEDHKRIIEEFTQKPGTILRKDGNPEQAFSQAHTILEKTYYCPFLAHNTMEPVNCFADVKADQAVIFGPTQAPEFIVGTIADILGIPKEKIQINLARMGGGFGLRAYSHHMVEAAVISQKAKAPIKLIYDREDDMTYGIYRPTYSATFRAALDKDKNLIGFHVKAGGIPETPIHPNRFPAGAIDNYLAESWEYKSNITIGAFRAPRSNFMASAEQSFLDELAEAMGKDPIAFRLELLDKAEKNPVGKNNDYDPKRYAGVLELVRDKSGWNSSEQKKGRGVSAYFCHNSYVAEVVDTRLVNNKLEVEKVHAAVDCGVVVNPDAAINMSEGGIVDGIGNALFGEMPFENGEALKSNFNTYRMIRMKEAPKSIEVHFVKNEIDPTGLGEPLFPPVFAALANSLYRLTGKRFYEQPFLPQLNKQNITI